MSIYQKAIDKFGKGAQLDMVVEECAELIHAIQKIKRNIYWRDNIIKNVVEELVDVEIMLEQLKYMLPKNLYEEARIFKLKRLEDLINEPSN